MTYPAGENLHTENCAAIIWRIEPELPGGMIESTIDQQGVVTFGGIGETVVVVAECGTQSQGPLDSMTLVIAKVDIFRGEEKITDKVTQIWVGELASLIAKVAPSWLNLKDPWWQIPGTVVKGYHPSLDSGWVEPLIGDDYKSLSIGYYWVDGSLPYTQRQATISVTASSAKQSVNLYASTWFLVMRPNATIQTHVVEPTTFLAPPPSPTPIGFSASAYLDFSIQSDVTQFSGGGRIAWVQLAFFHRINSGPSGVFQAWDYTQALDGGFPYAEATGPFKDSPAHAVLSSFPSLIPPFLYYNDMVVDDTLSLWLMFKPQVDGPSIWVPLRMLSWAWGGAAHWGGDVHPWAPTYPKYGFFTQAIDTLKFPVWTTHTDSPLKITGHNP